MTIEILDKRNIGTIKVSELKPGDAFMCGSNLFIYQKEYEDSSDVILCALLCTGKDNGRPTHISKSADVQQVSLTIQVHLV